MPKENVLVKAQVNKDTQDKLTDKEIVQLIKQPNATPYQRISDGLTLGVHACRLAMELYRQNVNKTNAMLT